MCHSNTKAACIKAIFVIWVRMLPTSVHWRVTECAGGPLLKEIRVQGCSVPNTLHSCTLDIFSDYNLVQTLYLSKIIAIHRFICDFVET